MKRVDFESSSWCVGTVFILSSTPSAADWLLRKGRAVQIPQSYAVSSLFETRSVSSLAETFPLRALRVRKIFMSHIFS